MRLTAPSRKAACLAFVLKSLEGRRAEIHATEVELAERIYAAFVPPEVEELMNKLPGGFLPSTKRIYAGVGDKRAISVEMEKSRRMPYNLRQGQRVDDAKALKLYEDLSSLKKAYKSLERKLREATTEVLESCSTVKQLLEVCPEMEPFVEKTKDKEPLSIKGAHLRRTLEEMGK